MFTLANPVVYHIHHPMLCRLQNIVSSPFQIHQTVCALDVLSQVPASQIRTQFISLKHI